MSQQDKFKGIMVLGRTKQDAYNKYTLAALGKGATVMVNESSGDFFLSHSSNVPTFDPATGEMELKEEKTRIDDMKFASESSEALDVVVYHAECSDSCGVHLVFEDRNMLKHCPSCTAVLSLSEDEPEAEEVEVDEGEEEVDLDMDSESEGEDEEDMGEEEDLDLDEEEDADAEMDSESSEEELNSESEGEDADEDLGEDVDEGAEDEEVVVDEEDMGDEEEDDEENAPIVVAMDTKEAASDAILEALSKAGNVSLSSDTVFHYMRCSDTSGLCGKHVIMEATAADVVHECPICTSALIEPEDSEDEEVSMSEEEEDENDLGVLDETDEDLEEEEELADETADEQPEEDVAESSETSESEGDEQDVEVDALEALEGNPSAEDLDVSYSSGLAGQPAWTAYVKGTPVAIALAKDAGENESMFNSQKFGQTLIRVASLSGVKEALKTLNFKPIVHKISISSTITRKIEEGVKAREEELVAQASDVEKDFEASLATAAVGINRGFFNGLHNPVKRHLFEALSAAGIANPEVLIDAAFREGSDEYHKTLLSKASEIARMPTEVKKALASSVLDMNYQSVSSGNPMASTSAEDRLSGIGTVVEPVGNINMGLSTSSDSDSDQSRNVQQRRKAIRSLSYR